jgi:DNA invertase Pin-like site-specific DNA recombinase
MSRMIAAYYRVSSRAQDLATQVAAVERAAKARGDIIERGYAEKRSGKTLARPELDKLRADARAGLLRRVYVFRLDRLTRSGIRDTLEVVEELKRHGVDVMSVSDGFDLQGPAAEIVLSVMAWASQMERQAINERISAARERVEAEGGHWGRPKRQFNLERARALQGQGRSVREIAAALKVPKSTVARALASQNVAAS